MTNCNNQRKDIMVLKIIIETYSAQNSFCMENENIKNSSMAEKKGKPNNSTYA